MKQKKLVIDYNEYSGAGKLNEADRKLLTYAQKATGLSYAPYSDFHVGAAALLSNGKMVQGFNQENASFPVGLCAERVLLSSVVSQYPGATIKAIAISYDNKKGKSDHPIFPCGICRQALAEFEARSGKKIRLLLGGMEGKIIEIKDADLLLPLAFRGNELK